MAETRLGTVLENACRLAGREPSLLEVPAGWRVLAAMAVNDGLRRLAAEKFPMMMRVELRRYRPDWRAEVVYLKGHEVWHGGDYWRLEDAAAAGEPGAAAGWRRLQMSEVAAFVAWSQPWENTVIDAGGVDPARFAYVADPKYNPAAQPVRATAMHALGVELASPAPKEVFCRFVPEFPAVSFDEWAAGGGCEPGDAAYRAATKDVYVCVAAPEDAARAPEGDAAAWVPFRVPAAFAPYLVRLAAADLLTEDQGKHQTRAAADAAFDELCARFHEGNGETRVRRGRFW